MKMLFNQRQTMPEEGHLKRQENISYWSFDPKFYDHKFEQFFYLEKHFTHQFRLNICAESKSQQTDASKRTNSS